MDIPAIAHQLEYHRLALEQDEAGAIERWARQFVLAREAGLLVDCRQLLSGIQQSGLSLSAHSLGTIARCRALLAQLLQEYDQAIGEFERARALFLQGNDDFNLSRVLNDLGTIFQARSEFAQAIAYYQQALARLLPRWEGTPEAAMMYNNLGVALTDTGASAEGTGHLEKAALLYRQLEMPQGAARVYINLGRQFRRQGEMERALTVYQEALNILGLFHDRRGQVDVLNSIGVVHRYQGKLAEAIDDYLQSLTVAQEVNDLDGQAQALNNLGNIYQLRSQYDPARYYYQEALELSEMLGDVSGQARGWGNLGDLASLADNDEQTALAYHQRALALYRQVSDKLGEGSALINIATVQRNLGAYAEAEALYLQAHAIGQQEQNLRLQDFALGALGTSRLLQEQWDEAESFLRQALTLQQQRGDSHAQVETIYKLGMLAYERGDYDQVLAVVEPGWEMASANHYGRWLHKIAWLVGAAFVKQGHIGGFNYYATAIGLALQYEDQRRYQWSLDELTGMIERMLADGERDEARRACEQVRSQLRREEWAEVAAPALAHFDALSERLNSEEHPTTR